MGREVRKVPRDWEHPKDERPGKFIPLHDGYNEDLQEFEDRCKEKGFAEAIDYFGGGPESENYMPGWPESERTHYMMYEDTSEGTPISPAFETPEKLASWLANTNASAFGGMTATYEQWLAMIKRGYAPSMIMDDSGMRSGVEAAED